MAAGMDTRIKKFLEGRGVSGDAIKQMEEDKEKTGEVQTTYHVVEHLELIQVDKYVLESSSAQSLARYLPCPGDQIAVQAFCKTLTPGKRTMHSERKNKILGSLRKKLLLKRKGSSDSEDSDSGTSKSNKKHLLSVPGNKNAVKNTRKIEIGWLNVENGAYVQVRTKRGGGTRMMNISKDASPSDILTAAKELFFHNGLSAMGCVDDFTFDVCDYSEVSVGSSVETVGQIYDRTKMNRLRFYMATKPKPTAAGFETTHVETLPDLGVGFTLSSELNNSDPEVFFNFNLMDSKALSSPINTCALNSTNSQTRPAATITSSSSLKDSPMPSSSLQEGMSVLAQAAAIAGLQETSESTSQATAVSALQDDGILPLSSSSRPPIISQNEMLSTEISISSNQVQADTMQTTQPPPQTTELIIHRGSLAFAEMCGYFKDPTILDKILTVIRILPNGDKEKAEDTGGVLRDLLSDFWSEFYSKCTLGQTVKIPCLRHDMAEEEWASIGRILAYGWENAGYWPIALSKTFLKHCIFPYGNINSQELLADFMEFVSHGDKDIFEKELADFDAVDFDDVLDALEIHECKTIVTASNLKPVLIEMSHKEIIQRPSFVSDCLRHALSKTNMTPQKLDDVYVSLLPTNKKVLGLLKFPDSGSTETGVYLKKYVRELDDSKLRLFLRFCTGADMITQPQIKVEYVKMAGFVRRPVSHTCGCLLELPDHYENFMEFRAEFDGVLNSKVWIMDIV